LQRFLDSQKALAVNGQAAIAENDGRTRSFSGDGTSSGEL
jgi:hypothetical protein